MKKTLLFSLLFTANADALIIPEDTDSAWYYSLGGESSTSQPANEQMTSIAIGATASIGLQCGAFDPVLGVANTLNNVKSGVDSMQNQLVNAATSGIANLPLLILQRANPGLYDMFMNSMASAEQRVTLATKSCEQMRDAIAQGENPYSNWVTLSRAEEWKRQAGSGQYRGAQTDAISAEEHVEKTGGNNGVTWLAGRKAGGLGQQPIKIPTDVVTAGYNQTLNRSVTSRTQAPANTRLSQLWSSPDEAATWSRSVLGEETFQTTGTPPQTVSPRGLQLEIKKEYEEIQPKLIKLLSKQSITDTDLTEVSAPSTVVTRDLIYSLRDFDNVSRNLFVTRLANDVATARTIERATALRQLLVNGLTEPNIHSAGPARTATLRYVESLNLAIDATLSDIEINKQLASSTGQTIKAVQQFRQETGTSTRIGSGSQKILPKEGMWPAK